MPLKESRVSDEHLNVISEVLPGEYRDRHGDAFIELRQKDPIWGPREIRAILQRIESGEVCPLQVSTRTGYVCQDVNRTQFPVRP